MTRDARAARTLITELEAHVPDLQVEREEPDGLGVVRVFRFTSDGHKGLDDVVSVVADNRIVNTRSIAKGVEVTFNHVGRVGDGTAPYGVDDAAPTLLTKKRPAKKVAVKPKGD